MRSRLLPPVAVAAALVASRPASAFLGADEDAANAALARRARPPDALSTSERPEARAAAAALFVQLGEHDRAAAILADTHGRETDCLMRTRRSELLSTPPCADVPPGDLPEASIGPPVAARIVTAGPGESGAAFFAAVTVSSIQALGATGTPELESTADRFRVRAGAILEGLWYLDDRVLVTAHALEGNTDAAPAALARLALLRPEHVLAAPSTDGGFTLQAEHASTRAALPVLTPYADPEGRFTVRVPATWDARATAEGVTFASPSDEHSWLAVRVIEERRDASDVARAPRRNPVARRKPGTRATLAPGDLLPESASFLEARGGELAARVTYEQAGRRSALVRIESLPGASVGIAAAPEGELAEAMLSSFEVTR